MSTKRDAESSDDPRVAEAVALWKKAPMLNVGQVMRAACFTEADSKNKNKRMWITRRAPTKKQMKAAILPSVVAMSTPESATSTLTPTTTTTEGTAKFPAPKPPRKRRTAQKHQDDKVANKMLKLHKKKAHKRATSLYAEEQKKENGMSSRAVAELVRKQYDGHGPTHVTIQRYVKNKMAGCSPLKRGEKGDIPEFVFKNLCIAFESEPYLPHNCGATPRRNIDA